MCACVCPNEGPAETKPDAVSWSPSGDDSVKSEAGVGKRSSVRDMAAMFRRT